MSGRSAGKVRERARRTQAAALAGALALTPGAAAAQESGPEAMAAARMLAVEGVKLARAGDCLSAIEPLTRAEALHHSSIVLAELGACYVQTRRLVAGSEALRRVVREGLPVSPSPAEHEALARAQHLLPEVLPKIAQLTVVVTGPSADAVALRIDGQSVPAPLLGAVRPTDPGPHRLEVSAPEFLPAAQDVQLAPGESRRLELALTPKPAPEPVMAASVSDGAPDVLEGESAPAFASGAGRFQLRRAAYVSWGVGAAGLITGAVFGALTLSDKQRLDQRCDGNLCPASARGDIVAAKRTGLVSTVSLAAGAAGAVAGSIAFLIARRADRRAATAWATGLMLAGGSAQLRF